MLKPPGSSSNRSRAYASNRRKTQGASPDDELRQLSRLPPNKKCADCYSKLPQCVNMTHGTFICMACAGIHRELQSKVKGLGHSTFSSEEVEKMKQTDNDKANNVWLAKYSPGYERMKMPQGNQNQQQLRAWIRRKYHDRAWYGGGPSQVNGGTPRQRPPPQRPNQPPQQQQPQPTMVQMPPQDDLLGGFGASPAPAQQQQGDFANFGGQPQAQSSPAPKRDDGWDAFGGSSTQQQQQQSQNNFANFGGSTQGQQNDPFATPQQPQQQQQQQNFANFNQQPAQQPNDPFASSGAPSQQQNNFANFGGQQPNQPAQQQQNFGNFGGQQPQNQQQQNFGDFNQPQNVPVQQSNQASMQANQQGQGFGNFAGQQAPQQQQQQQQQQNNFGGFGQAPQQNMAMQPNQQVSMQPQANQQGQQAFGNFGGQQPQQTVPQVAPQQQNTAMQPNQQASMQPQASQQAFGDFGQASQQSMAMLPNQQPQVPATQQGQQAFGNFEQQPQQTAQPSVQQQNFGDFGPPQQQQQQQQQNVPPSPQAQPVMPSPANQQGQVFGNFGGEQPQQMMQPVAQEQPNMAMQPNQQTPANGQGEGFGSFGGSGQQAGSTTMQPTQNQTAPNQMPSPQMEQPVAGNDQGPPPLQSMQPTMDAQPSVMGAPTTADPMDAFAHLSLEPTDLASEQVSEPVSSVAATEVSSDKPSGPKYKEKQIVAYKSNGKFSKAEIEKVHLDDALEPFYTIKMEFGKEKQTDDAHLQGLSPLYSKIEQSILSLSASQMEQVEEFLSKLQSDSTPTMTPAVAIEPALSVPPSQPMAPQIPDSGGMNQGTQKPQMTEQSLPDMSTFGGMSQQGLQMPEPSMPQSQLQMSGSTNMSQSMPPMQQQMNQMASGQQQQQMPVQQQQQIQPQMDTNQPMQQQMNQMPQVQQQQQMQPQMNQMPQVQQQQQMQPQMNQMPQVQQQMPVQQQQQMQPQMNQMPQVQQQMPVQQQQQMQMQPQMNQMPQVQQQIPVQQQQQMQPQMNQMAPGQQQQMQGMPSPGGQMQMNQPMQQAPLSPQGNPFDVY